MSTPGRLLLCSGGLDSVCLLMRQQRAGDRLTALFIDYGQMNVEEERASARHFCAEAGVALIQASLAGAFPPSGLSSEAEQGTYLEGKSRFFLPMRNGVFIALAVSWAMRHGCRDILVGSVRADSRHLDSGEPFMTQMRELVEQCSGGQVSVSFPLAALSKAEVIAEVAEHADLPEIFRRTYSCYFPKSSAKVREFAWGFGCGSCLSCRGRRAALGEA